MVMLHAAFFDASGKCEGFDILTVAGAAAPMKKWERFDAQWREALADEKVKEFHATDFHSSKGEYAGWKGDKRRRSAFLVRLGKIIKQNTNKLFCCSVELAGWREVNEEYCLEEFFYSPYALAGLGVVESVLKWAVKKRGQIIFIFEDGDKGWEGLVKLCARYQVIPNRASKKIAIPCQAADMIAWKTRITGTNALRYVGQMNKSSRDDELDFIEASILKELKGMDKVMVRPVKNGIFTAENLRKTCELNKIPRRGKPVKLERISQMPQ